MARTEITPIRATLRNTPCAAVTTSALFTAIDATNGNKIKWRDADENYIIALQNSDSSAAKTVTFEKGDSDFAAVDMAISVPATKTVILSIDSARFKRLSGDDKGCILLNGDAAIKVAIFSAP